MKLLFILLMIYSGILFSQQLPQYAPGQAIIKLTEDAFYEFGEDLLSLETRTSNEEMNMLFDSIGVERVENILKKIIFDSVEEEIGLNRTFVIYFPVFTDSEIEDIVNDLKRSYLIDDAFPNSLGYELVEPNDPNFSSQSNLQRIKMPQAWDIEKGSNNIRLAIFDTGFQPAHQEINSKIYLQKDFVDINFADYPNWTFFVNEGEDYQDIDDDASGLRTHGTEVAQVAAAVTNNGYGVAGVGWNTPVILVRVGFQAIHPIFGLGGYVRESNFIEALNWARTSNTMSVINMSLAISVSPNPLVQNVITACINSGIVIIAAAGNDGGPVRYPAAYSGVIAVSGVNLSDINSGWNVGPQLSVVAPANGVWINSSGNPSFGVGTSLSAPLVAGTAALILSQKPDLTPALVKKIIEVSAVKIPGMNGQNFHNYYGYGLLDVYEALRATNSIYTFTNKIMSNDYGFLVIDNDKNNPVSAGSKVPFKYNTPHNSRTGELPFLLNYSGTTQKFNRWYEDNFDYNLLLQFTANNISPSTKDANFEATVTTTIKNNYPEVGFIDPSSDNIKFKDPWFFYKDVNNDWFQSNEFKQYDSPFNILNNSTNSYGGVFLDQNFTDPNKPYYSVQAVSPQTININGKNHNFYYQEWSGSNVSFQNTNNITTGVVFNNANAVVNANYKGTQLSNNEDAFVNNSQKKIVKTIDGHLHMTYESLDRVWYERSTDNGLSWEIMNDGKPLSNNLSKNPVIDVKYKTSIGGNINDIGIVFFEQNGSHTNIVFYGSGTNYSHNYPSDNPYVIYTKQFPIDNDEQLSFTWKSGYALIIWKENYDGVLNINRYKYWYGNLVPQGVFTIEIDYLNCMQDLGTKPALASIFSGNYYHLVWQTGNNIIKYVKLIGSSSSLAQSGVVQNLSSGSGFTSSYNPSLIVMDDDIARVCWIGERIVMNDKEYKVNPGNSLDDITLGNTEKKVVFRAPDSQYYWNYSNNVNSPTITRTYPTQSAKYFMTFSKLSGSSYTYHFVANTALNTINQITGPEGAYIQTSNGTTEADIVEVSFKTSGLPYTFKRTTGIKQYYQQANKIMESVIGAGREGVVYKDSLEFYFTVGDITVNGEVIDFVSINDSISNFTLESLNQYLLSEPFSLNDNSIFTYGVLYGVVNPLTANEILNVNDYIQFKVELIDNNTGEILGVFDEITYNQENVLQYANIAYQVNTDGIGNRIVRLRLNVNTNFGANYSLSSKYSEEELIAKSNIKEISFQGSLVITEYAISQNYPNPFNPTTTITYQLPQDGFVTLKVYDILGREVVTLVNEQKSIGRYYAQFDATALSSGVYIYKVDIKGIDGTIFSDIKQMMLLK